MKKIAILNNDNILYDLIEILEKHFVPFVICELNNVDTISQSIKNNTICLFKINNINDFKKYTTQQNFKNNIYFDAIFFLNTEYFDFLKTFAKVLITSFDTLHYKSTFQHSTITFGFDKSSNITYSSIMEKNNYTHLMVYIQNSFNTLYNTKMIKFEFSITTNLIDIENLNRLLGIITMCLYLDVRFDKNEFATVLPVLFIDAGNDKYSIRVHP